MSLTVATCPQEQIETDGGAGCRDLPPLRLQVRHALLVALMIGLHLLRTVGHVLRRVAALRWPALTTYLRPSRTGAGGPMCWADEAGALAGLGAPAATCLDLPISSLVRFWRAERDRRGAPVLAVVVERWLAAGWRMRGATAIL